MSERHTGMGSYAPSALLQHGAVFNSDGRSLHRQKCQEVCLGETQDRVCWLLVAGRWSQAE